METRSEMKTFRILGVCLLFLCLMGVSAQANLSELYVFGQITGGSSGLCPDAFTMEVQDMGDQALFTFSNNCDNGGVLGRIFIRENDLITFNSIYDQSEGVSFSDPDYKNAMLPGGHDLGFTSQNTYAIEADPARPKNGLHYQDYVSVLFDMNDGVLFPDVINSISGGTLGVGLHVQSLPGGASASFTATPIPEPATLILLGIGAFLVQHKKRDTAQ